MPSLGQLAEGLVSSGDVWWQGKQLHVIPIEPQNSPEADPRDVTIYDPHNFPFNASI